MAEVASFFQQHAASYNIAAIGLACFGPICLTPGSAKWGQISRTPKPGWEDTKPHEILRKYLGDIPIGIQTDVGSAAMAEAKWGKGRGCPNMTYITIGTGIGGANIVDGRLANGHTHSELGHMIVKKHPKDPFQGVCGANHIDCIEGLASGSAIAASTHTDLKSAREPSIVYEYVAYYVGQLCANVFFCNAPQRIILGGGVMRTPGLVETIRKYTAQFINGYLAWPSEDTMNEAIVLSHWAKKPDCPIAHEVNAGALGGLIIAENALNK